jgi:tripartite-type tricarboxylate transporter receptor subunit TctC
MAVSLRSMLVHTAGAAALLSWTASCAMAQATEADFFKGKTVTVVVGAAAGGGLDIYARLVSRHFSKHIPGNPSVVVSNQPGAGGTIVARSLYATGPRDGTQIVLTFASVLIDALYTDAKRGYDATRFLYVGNANSETPLCFMRQDTVSKLEDMLTKEFILGATTPGSTVVDFPVVTKSVLGAKYRIVAGYKGTRDIFAAIEKGEVHGICGIGFATLKVAFPNVLEGKLFARVVAQEDVKGHKDLNALGIPLMMQLVRNEPDRELFRYLYAQNTITRPFLLPPDVPAQRLATLRTAFMAMMKDPALVADAARLRVDVDPLPGEKVQEIVKNLYSTPKPLVERLKKILATR